MPYISVRWLQVGLDEGGNEMHAIMRKWRKTGIVTCQRGATAVEYGLICAMIVLAMLIALQSVATKTSEMWGNISNKVTES